MIDSIRENMVWRGVVAGGIIGGTAFILANALLNIFMLEVSSPLIINYSASIVLGESALAEGGALVTVVGVLVCYLMALIFAGIIGIVVHRWGLLVGIVGGAILGLAIYGINFYTMTLLFPWMFAINSSAMAISHVLFGAVAGGVYELLDNYDQPLEVGA